MKVLFSVALLAATALLHTPAAQAQSTAPTLPAPADPARARRQQQMTPEEAARDQQLQILEARTGNTSFGAEKSGPYRQLDKGNGAFTVRKFKALPGQEQQRGVSKRVVMGADPKGKPLEHKHPRRKRFLFF